MLTLSKIWDKAKTTARQSLKGDCFHRALFSIHSPTAHKVEKSRRDIDNKVEEKHNEVKQRKQTIASNLGAFVLTRDAKDINVKRLNAMEPRLRQANIVIIASAHNPSIIAPEWLKANTLIVEDPIYFVHTPDFSVFESQSFSLIVDRHRLQITAKKQDKGTLKTLSSAASNYVRLLPHIPYRAAGLNFVWSVEDETKKLPKIDLNIGRSDLVSVLEGHALRYGGIIYARKEPYMLKLIIEPEGENALVFNLNYHHELTGITAEGIITLLDSFLDRYEDSSRVIKALLPRGNK